jgi:hypothetical protein
MATTTAARPAIAVTGRQKSFGDKDVLDSIDLTVQEGTIFALLCIGRRHSLLPTGRTARAPGRPRSSTAASSAPWSPRAPP